MNSCVRALLQWFFGTPKKLKQVGYFYILVSISVIVASVWVISGLIGCATLHDPNSLEGRQQTIINERAQNCIAVNREYYGGVDMGSIMSVCYDAARRNAGSLVPFSIAVDGANASGLAPP